MKLAIFGSCVSRDAVRFMTSEQVELTGYYARSSLASVAAPPLVDESALSRITSDFQRSMVRIDMDKSFLRDLPKLEFDVLLVDLIDERFPVLIHPEGSVHTLSAEYAATGASETDVTKIAADSVEKMVLWQNGWAALIGVLEQGNRVDHLYINRVYWGHRDVNGRDIDTPSRDFIDRMNRHLDQMYEIIASTRPDIRFITYPPEDFDVDPDHRWGLAPFHYRPALYHHTAAALGFV